MAMNEQKQQLLARYEALKAEGLQLDMTRGKPAPEQLALADGLVAMGPEEGFELGGVDCRNYGGLTGLAEVRALMAAMLDLEAEDVILGNNASLELMFDTLMRAHVFGVPGGEGPWVGQKVKWLCPAPGYDRHFKITEHLGYELVLVPMTGEGPDMEVVEALVKDDPTVKGIWVVPKYANPTGESVSDAVCQRLAEMETAAPDFRIMWDNAYAVHHLGEGGDEIGNILRLCEAAGNPERVFVFGSTSKISHAGSGISVLGASQVNLKWTQEHLSKQSIGPDKMSQLRHLRFFKDVDGIRAHMAKHAAILKPKFDAVLQVLDAELGGLGVAEWTRPKGGYFISFNTAPGHAKAVVQLAAEAGVKLTQAGATFPYGRDPEDRNIRLAPSFPSLEEVIKATEVVAVAAQLAPLL